MDFNFGNNIFLNLIKSKESQIIKKTTDTIQESEGFKVVFAGLKAMIKNNAFKGEKVILISETDIRALKLENISDFNALFVSNEFTYNTTITLNHKLEITSVERERLIEDGNDARKHYSGISKSGSVVFLLLKDEINYFISGDDESESPFFSLVDVNRHHAKRKISEINEVFSLYQESLKERRNYTKFFINVSHLKSLRVDMACTGDEKIFISDNKQTLRNRPEDTFRDDLRQFLTVNLRVSQVKEFILENMRRLDIYLFGEYGEIYLIEVKWVGQSVHQNGKRLGTEYFAKTGSLPINPDAFYQALDYLEELDNKGQNIVRGYLVVFDARKEDLDDTGDGFDATKLSTIQEKHYRKFEKIKDLRVKNTHPA